MKYFAGSWTETNLKFFLIKSKYLTERDEEDEASYMIVERHYRTLQKTFLVINL